MIPSLLQLRTCYLIVDLEIIETQWFNYIEVIQMMEMMRLYDMKRWK